VEKQGTKISSWNFFSNLINRGLSPITHHPITAYIALLVVAVLYLSKSGEYSATLASACKKAEAMSQALKRES
jgi:hypothetical protein